jgi:hypothetical protein
MSAEFLPSEPSLSGVFLKLDRAEHHLDRLEAEVGRYNAAKPYSVPEQLEPATDGWFVARLHITESPDAGWGLRVGEFLHNTRSALDNLVWQLVLLNQREPWDKNQFPIYTNAAKPPSRRRLDDMLRGVGTDERTFIEELQPYLGEHLHRRTRVALKWLVTLSNTDKHRYLHPAVGVLDPLKVSTTTVASTHPMTDNRSSTHHLLQDGAELLAIRTSPDARVVMEGEVAFDVAFGHPQVTVSLLDGIHEQVGRVIERFASAFPA